MTEPVATSPRPIATHAAPPRRRRWPWVVLALTAVVLVAAVGGALWWASERVADGARTSQGVAHYPLTITTVDGSTVSYTTPRPDDEVAHDAGLMGVVSIFGGYAQTDAGPSNSQSTSRTVTKAVIAPPLAQNQPVTLDPWYYPRNPQVGLGLDYEDVTYDAPEGPTPAWFIPGSSSTWVVYVHGLGATPLEGLRIAKVANGLGHPVLLIRYRDDAHAPVDDGLARFGADEWPDLESAVQYALDHGAHDVVIAGTGMGASIALALQEKSALADSVRGLFLDSPVTDARAVLEADAVRRGVPSWAASVASTVAGWRYGFDWGSTDYAARAGAITTPTVVVSGDSDGRVPPAGPQQFAEVADPDVVTLTTVGGAGYGTAWNVDPSGYETLFAGLLGRAS